MTNMYSNKIRQYKIEPTDSKTDDQDGKIHMDDSHQYITNGRVQIHHKINYDSLRTSNR